MGNTASVVQQAAHILIPLAGGTAIGIGLRGSVKEWYPSIKKPKWTPPSYLFGPVWAVLYTMMGVASYRVMRAGGGALPLGLYAAQLCLNFAWSPLFFQKRDLKLATIDITALLGVLGATIWEFNKVDPVAAQLLLPYAGWASFATALTWNIYLNNKDEDQKPKEN